MPHIISRAAILVLPLVLGAGVSSAAPETTPTAPVKAAPAEAKVAGPPKPWKEMSGEEKGKYMKTAIMPKMKVAFQTFDGEAFKKFGCPTCHGKDPKASKFKMPSPDVHALPGTPEAFQAKMAKEPTWPKFAKFMGETVKPQMAALLGLPEFDPKNHAAGGFGCQNCHTIEK